MPPARSSYGNCYLYVVECLLNLYEGSPGLVGETARGIHSFIKAHVVQPLAAECCRHADGEHCVEFKSRMCRKYVPTRARQSEGPARVLHRVSFSR